MCHCNPNTRSDTRDANVEAVRQMLLDRSNVGIKKYGVTTERQDLTPIDWAKHALEEALDFAVYLMAFINSYSTTQPVPAADIAADGPQIFSAASE